VNPITYCGLIPERCTIVDQVAASGAMNALNSGMEDDFG
jgi:hypothetical protein